MKAEQRVNQRCLARAIRTQQSNRSTAQLAAQGFENWSTAETYRETVEGDDTGAIFQVRVDNCVGVCHSFLRGPATLSPRPGHSKSAGTLPRINQRWFLRREYPTSSEIISRVPGPPARGRLPKGLDLFSQPESLMLVFHAIAFSPSSRSHQL